MKLREFDIQIAVAYLPYIINDDCSGLLDEEVDKIDAYLSKCHLFHNKTLKSMTITVLDEPSFVGYCNISKFLATVAKVKVVLDFCQGQEVTRRKNKQVIRRWW